MEENQNMVNNNSNKNAAGFIILLLIIIIIGMGLYILYSQGIIFKNDNTNSTTNNEQLDNNLINTSENSNGTSETKEKNYTFTFKNNCEARENDEPAYVNIYLDGKLLKKLDNYQTYKEIEINNKRYFLLSKIGCTDLLTYNLVLDENLNEVYSNDDFLLYTSNKYIIIYKINDSVDLLNYNWKFVKSIENIGPYVGNNYYLKLEGNDYNIYDYDNKFIGKLFTKTDEIDVFVPFGPKGPSTKIENGEEIVSISAMNSKGEVIYPYYNVTTKESGIAKN